MIIRIWKSLRDFVLARQAAAWVIAIDEDRERNEPGFQRWLGGSEARERFYERAHDAYHGAAEPTRRLYPTREHRRHPVEPQGMWARNGAPIAITVAALLIAAAGCRLVLLQLDRLARADSEAKLASQDYSTQIGEIRTFRMPDGSVATLDTDSLIRVALTDGQPNIDLLRGRARFEVSQTSRALVVKAGGATVTADRAVFDIETDQAVRIRLIAGRATVAYPADDSRAQPAVEPLIAGQEVAFDPAIARAPAAPTRFEAADTQWTSELRTFDDVPLQTVINEVNRYSTTRIEFENPYLEQQHVFLDIDVRDSENVAQTIARKLDLEVGHPDAHHLILRSKTTFP